MRIVVEPFLVSAAKDYPTAAAYLDTWRKVVKAATWHTLANAPQSCRRVDAVLVQSGRTVLVSNVCGNTYRLTVAVHFNRQIVCTLRFLTHAEYRKDTWKAEL